MAINNTGSRRLLVTLTALFAALCGLYLLIGGGWLVAIGGSWYYPIAGLVMLGVAWMLWRSKRAALWLYAALLLGTMIWGVWEVGFDFWALTPRSDILVFFGIWLILPFVWRRLVIPASGAVAALVVALLISGGILTWAGFNDPQEINGTLSADATPAEAISPVADQDWPAYGRNQEGQRFSPLKQINADNVHNLKEAWVFRTGDVKQPNDPGEITNEVTPIKVGDTLYLCTAHQRLFALDAASGKEKWHYDPELKTNESFQHVTFKLRKGEILGFGGLSESGMHEIGKAIFGASYDREGTVELADGTQINDIPTAIKHSIAYTSKDRDNESVVLNQSIGDNICLPSLDELSGPAHLISDKKKKDFANKFAKQMSVKMVDVNQFVSNLSGGNKQKVVLARWIGKDSDIVVLDSPTRGIDIKVKQDIYQLMNQMRKNGKSIIMISEELMELIGMCDRIMIMKDGKISGELERDQNLDENGLITMMV